MSPARPIQLGDLGSGEEVGVEEVAGLGDARDGAGQFEVRPDADEYVGDRGERIGQGATGEVAQEQRQQPDEQRRVGELRDRVALGP